VEKVKGSQDQNVEVNWREYFASINHVCKWSLKYWDRGEIDVVKSPKRFRYQPLQKAVARVYYNTEWTSRQLEELADAHNAKYPDEEWLWSSPEYKGNSTPVPVVIQQDRGLLEQARREYKQKKE
jgi:hypothetical protein